MQLSVLDIAIIIDTLRGSLSIADGGDVWSYRKDARLDLVNRLCAAAAVTPNNAVYLTPAAGGSRADNDMDPQAQVTADH